MPQTRVDFSISRKTPEIAGCATRFCAIRRLRVDFSKPKTVVEIGQRKIDKKSTHSCQIELARESSDQIYQVGLATSSIYRAATRRLFKRADLGLARPNSYCPTLALARPIRGLRVDFLSKVAMSLLSTFCQKSTRIQLVNRAR